MATALMYKAMTRRKKTRFSRFFYPLPNKLVRFYFRQCFYKTLLFTKFDVLQKCIKTSCP